MRVAVILLAACASESGGGGGPLPSGPEPVSWNKRLEQTLAYDATTVNEYTFEAAITLTESHRTSGPYTGFSVLVEVVEPVGNQSGNEIEASVSIEGQSPDMYDGSAVSRGVYTHGHAKVIVPTVLATCMVGPCSATERYTLRLATKAVAMGSIDVRWTADLRLLLPYYEGQERPPATGEMLTLVLD